MSKSAPTSADVARLAGVSRPTVNRVLGGYGYASPDTIDKVKAAATSLGYRQNAAARTLLTGRSGTVGVIVVDIENPYFSTIVAEVCRAAQAAGYQTLIMSSEGDSTVEAQAVEAMLAQRVDGLIIAPNSASATDHLDAVTAVGVPVVAIDRIPVASQLNTVSIDNVQAGYDATCLLIEEGRKRIGIVTYDPRPHAAIWAALDTPNPHELNPSPQRLLGYLQALRSAGLRADPDLIAFAPKQSN